MNLLLASPRIEGVNTGVTLAQFITACQETGVAFSEDDAHLLIATACRLQNESQNAQIRYDDTTKSWKLVLIENHLADENFVAWLENDDDTPVPEILTTQSPNTATKERKLLPPDPNKVAPFVLSVLLKEAKISLQTIAQKYKSATLQWVTDSLVPFLTNHLGTESLCLVEITGSEQDLMITLRPNIYATAQKLTTDEQAMLTGLLENRALPLLEFTEGKPERMETLLLTTSQLLFMDKAKSDDEVTLGRQEMFWLLCQACFFEERTDSKQLLEKMDISKRDAQVIRALFRLVTTSTAESALSFEKLLTILCLKLDKFQQVIAS